MRLGGGGSIVNVSSMAGFVGFPGLHLGYNASKGAVRLLTKGAAARHGVDGIRVNSVHPGLLPPMLTSQTTRDPARRAQVVAAVPLRREGSVDEVAQAILFLASDRSSYVTGAELAVDGGYTAV
jgi:NAD(P)-dependent dehydrogenase (short-subunit alcohol dehydrogenase family)